MIKIFLDTDMGSDCDDAGALSLLHNLASEGKAEILAVTHCASEISGPYCVEAINEWYGRKVPIGRYDTKTFLEGGIYCRYTEPIMKNYLKTHTGQRYENATRLMRKVLSENSDVVLVTVGMFNNVAELMLSEGDDISPLSGVELIKKSVACMYSMGGHFSDLSYAEFNIKNDIENAKYVSENFPAPIVYCGFEIGENVLTGINLIDADENHPVKFAYAKNMEIMVRRGEKPLRSSWDPITVYCAVEQENDIFEKSEGCKITFDDEGRVVLEPGGKDFYMISKVSDEEIRDVIDKYIK